MKVLNGAYDGEGDPNAPVAQGSATSPGEGKMGPMCSPDGGPCTPSAPPVWPWGAGGAGRRSDQSITLPASLPDHSGRAKGQPRTRSPHAGHSLGVCLQHNFSSHH